MADSTLLAEEAVAWHLRLPDLPGHEWPAFVAWLERSEGHRAAYDRVAAADALLGEAAPAPGVASAPASWHPAAGPRLARRRAWQAGAVAAAIALVAGWTLWPATSGIQLEQTAAGTIKELAFADGTRIDLNGASALALDQAHPRAVRLDAGEATFRVRHAARPFTVQAGGFTLRDLGTVFNVQLSERALKLDVTEGSVLFDPGGANLTVAAGQGLTVDRARNLVVRRAAATGADWTRGELAFEDAPLAEVAEAIHRRYGTRISLSEGLSSRSFTGNIRLAGNESDDVAHFAGLIGAKFHREGQGWAFLEASGAR